MKDYKLVHTDQDIESPIRADIFSTERMDEYATFLASQLKVVENQKHAKPLLPRVRKNGQELLAAYRALAEALGKKEVISPAAAWLTDNFHIVEEQLREIRDDLPKSYYNDLPKLGVGYLAGYPRIYAIALALVAHTDSQLEPVTIKGFLCSFQTVTPLKIGELWALPITLRIVLVENLRRLSVGISRDHEQLNSANQFVDQLFHLIGDQSGVGAWLSTLKVLCNNPVEHQAYLAQIAKRLRDQGAETWPALEHFEKLLAEGNQSKEQVVFMFHQTQATNQMTMANIITSMRLFAGMDWRDFVESISLIDRILGRDQVYSQMDFPTRDCYRHAIERLARRSSTAEIEIAEDVLKLAEKSRSVCPSDTRRSHVGYYLVGNGSHTLTRQLGVRTASFFPNFSRRRPNLTYFGTAGLLMVAALILPLKYLLMSNSPLYAVIGIGLLILIPCSELALNFANLILTHTTAPQCLPKLKLTSGIPRVGRTIVAIPCLLSNSTVIQELLEKLEVHSLGNADPQLFFALLTDFNDAKERSAPTDTADYEAASRGIELLNQKYGEQNQDRFFLFHRERKWNDSEQAWMGWERKRGKLQEFNSLVRGDINTTFVKVAASFSFLKTIRYVLTLDADTQLPRDSARKLVGTILHPLNQPQFDKTLRRVTEGYGILQPRIGISLESSNRSLFAKVFSSYTGVDPYTTAVSDVYQDIFGEGSYAGKGLYDIDSFSAALQDRVPDNQVLSHDLFEGSFARTALVTDVELLDDFPQSYSSFFKRQHRWIRGDWQIVGWIFPFVKNAKGEWKKNDLSASARWKIFDNLRRSLVSPFIFAWFALGFAVLPGSTLFWLAYAAFIIAFPFFTQAITSVCTIRRGERSWHAVFEKIFSQIHLLQMAFYFIFLAYQALLSVDAIIRVSYRQIISKRNFLEWTTAVQAEGQPGRAVRPIWQKIWPIECLLVGIALLAWLIPPEANKLVIAFVVLWMSYPLLGALLNRQRILKNKKLDTQSQSLMRQTARRTWHYFETYVGAEESWLPPDNYQEAPQPRIAHRTSPTNIGLYLLSLVSARDFGYLSTSDFLKRICLTLASLEKLEQYNGHYFNWYDTQTMAPLNPKYISTVDSGNLAGYLLVGRQACLEVSDCLLVDNRIIEGIKDAVAVLETELRKLQGDTTELRVKFKNFLVQLAPPKSNTFTDWLSLLNIFLSFFEDAKDRLARLHPDRPVNDLSAKTKDQLIRLIESNLALIRGLQNDISVYAPWTQDSNGWENIKEPLDRNICLSKLSEAYANAISTVLEATKDKAPAQKADGSAKVVMGLKIASRLLTDLMKNATTAAEQQNQIFERMNFQFLLDPVRKVFSVGYNVTQAKLDKGYYDLLGSEARLASFIAIAKGDINQEHWFRLGRQLVPVPGGGRALVSWTASMFEYLMPLLVMRDYENTLLNETAHSIVARQIDYGKQHAVPWGVSESGYNGRDLLLNYQYGPFGIPGLGLKRGLGHDLVISPYSTFLAAMVNPTAAVKNIRRLISENVLTNLGFYESIDYTASRLPENQKFAIVKSFMAHHSGMSLVAINNVVNQCTVQNRFHADPRVKATRLLLQERVPHGVTPALPKVAEIELGGNSKATNRSLVRHYCDPNHSSPRVHILSNRTYSLMISTAGAGYSSCDDLAVTRWREDATLDGCGSYIFIKDNASGEAWSSTYQPLGRLPESYQATFSEDKVEFERRDGDISSYTQILVAPEDNVEIRHITLTNHSDKTKILEITSYLEPVLDQRADDLAHQAFNKLFIQTEFLASKKTLIATRRKRTPHDQEICGLHVVVTDAEIISEVESETSRELFIGRGRTLANAIAIKSDHPISNTCGATLDPIMSLRIKIRIPANGKAQVAFTTGLTTSRNKALEIADRYHDIHSFERERQLAWTKAQADLNHLGIDTETAYLFQRIAERILYADGTLRAPADQRALNTSTQSTLWPRGISGDLPILVISIGDKKDTAIIHQLLRCHEYLRLKGLKYDFVIVCDREISYFQDVQESLQQQIRSTGSQSWLNKSGGVFVLRRETVPEMEVAHILAVARVSLRANELLSDQVNRKSIKEKYPNPLKFKARPRTDQNLSLQAPLDADYSNGYGGFSKDGLEYVIDLQPGEWTPAPWINVVGNRLGFGFQVSESGSGFTWAINSQTNRLTTWSNDPVCDPPGEIIYLRDDETGTVWTPTPLPVRSDAPYKIRHGQGYTIFEHASYGLAQTLTIFVPKDDTIKISLLKIKNLTDRKRKISITSYTEWVLGTQREKAAPYLICDYDQESGAIFARNPYDNDFATHVAFADMNSANKTFTCSRKEFLGRNGSYENPSSLLREELSDKRGTGQDPCGAFQSTIELEPGSEYEVAILLGQCDSAESARSLTVRYRDPATIQTALNEVISSWGKILGTVQIKTPENSMNLLMNRWLLYQTLSCRYWARTAFYQSGGAYGFRDQLQDCMAFVYAAPNLTREHILRAAAHQFKEGDVQHWWHPPTGRGIRTRVSDDLLWLPFVVSFYIEVTGDASILQELIPYLDAPALEPSQEDSYTRPNRTSDSFSIFDHCTRAIDHSLALGEHGLPLIGTGDWNDGMNRIGNQGKGESIWLGWFLYKVLADFIPLCDKIPQNTQREKYKAHMKKMKAALEQNGWDGDWYKRAYYDDGTAVGSAESDECQIDSIAQSWAVISGGADRSRAKQAMLNVEKHLIREDSQLILLFTPPFDKGLKDPGYVKGYVPGVRENGGQYTHAATWVAKAYAELKDGNNSFKAFQILNPILHSQDKMEADLYKIEPYVLAGDVYAGGSLEGRGGWSWYTGSAAWYYRVGLESILGFQLRGNHLKIAPCIPSGWKEYEIVYKHLSSSYSLQIKNPQGLSTGQISYVVDGLPSSEAGVELIDDGKTHIVLVTLNAKAALRQPLEMQAEP